MSPEPSQMPSGPEGEPIHADSVAIIAALYANRTPSEISVPAKAMRGYQFRQIESHFDRSYLSR